MSVLIMAALGLDHVSNCVGEIKANLIGVDLVVRGMLIAAWKTWKENLRKMTVYNAASMRDFNIDILRSLTPIPKTYYSIKAVSPQYGFIIESKFLAFVLKVFLTLIPFAVIDGVLMIVKKKPMLVKIQRTITNVLASLTYFMGHYFLIDNEKFLELNKELNDDEKYDFEIIMKYPFYDISEKYYQHVLKNLFKETDEDRKKAKRLYPLVCGFHYFFISLYVYIFYKIIYKILNNFEII